MRLFARWTDPETSHIAMKEVDEGKITNAAEAVMEMLRANAWHGPKDTQHGDDIQQSGLTDWEMTEMLLDVDSPRLSYLDPWRQRYQDQGGNNTAGFVRMGRKFLFDNGYVINTGWRRRNEYVSVTFGHRKGSVAQIWHVPAVPVTPPTSERKQTRADLEDEVDALREENDVLRSLVRELTGEAA